MATTSQPPGVSRSRRERARSAWRSVQRRVRTWRHFSRARPTIRVIVNPAAGKDRPFLKTFNQIFREAGYDWDMVVTKDSWDGARLAQEAVQDGVDIVVAYGGDGTVMETACGLVGSDVPLGIIPGGTGNVVSVELGISKDLETAARLIVDPGHQVRPMDMGELLDEPGSAPLRRCFLLRAGVGFEANVLEGADRSAKDQYGIFAYLMSAVQALREPTVARYHLTIDGQVVDVEGLAVLIANVGNLGMPGLALSPTVDTADGLLDVFVIQRASLGAILSIAASVVGGNEPPAPVLRWTAQEVRVEADPPQPVQGDGELLGESPLHVRVVPQAIRVIVPGESKSPPGDEPEGDRLPAGGG